MSNEKQAELDTERSELNLLINRGVKFTVEVSVFTKRRGFAGRFLNHIKTTEEQVFEIKEPTLSTLDRMSAEWIEVAIDENEMSSENALSFAKKMTQQHAKRFAKIIAIAVLGSDYSIPTQSGSYKYDEKRLTELTNLFFHNVKSSKLLRIMYIINTMTNLGDFTNSIRLMSANRTTVPIRIEENKEG